LRGNPHKDISNRPDSGFARDPLRNGNWPCVAALIVEFSNPLINYDSLVSGLMERAFLSIPF